MIPFLKETAKALLDSGRDLKDIRLVLPNRRAGLFFTKYLGELICRCIACQLVHQLLNGEHFWHPNGLINKFPQVLGKK